ncbi:PucR family transcriptional regulator [Leucobacter sp. M11]|uniref:PucR family transcriptional regulator n=1 Tax=Leucobacter sp. M11 TaxID=2993565 RepID=UPI002D7F37C0|nr:helix-turn-helix domain-containing protein [Leucobacter sp. M11]MEB4616370.1 helix-turn-helix domain-containing protein [Leucobacter sp. M11]
MPLSKSMNSSLLPLSTGLPLRSLVEQLGEGVLTQVHGSERPLALLGVTYYDTDLGSHPLTGQLLLLTAHAELGPDRLEQICAALRQGQASGVVARSARGGDEQALARACARHDLPLLELAPGVGWREFDALVSRLLGEHGAGLQLGTNSSDRLFSVANHVAQAFGGSVAIEDHRRNILAYSALPGQAIDPLRASGILTRRTPDGPLNEVRYRQVFAADGISRFPTEHEFAPRAALPLRAGNIPLGSIWVIDPNGDDLGTPIPPEKREVLVRAAELAAGYIVDAWRFDHGDERSKETALRRLFSGTPQENDSTVLGIRPEQSCLVLAIDSGQALEGDLSELRSAVSRHLSVYVPGSICSVMDGKVVALVPSTATAPVARSLERLLPELFRLTGRESHCGLSDPRRPSSSLSADYERAVRVAECARSLRLPVATPDTVQPQLVLLACADALRGGDLVLPETAELLAEGQEETRETLLAWFEERGSAPRVAERLSVHEQTVRYRMRQATSRFGIDLNDPDRTLTLWLQLRLAGLSEGAAGGRLSVSEPGSTGSGTRRRGSR